ncbi:MAG: penicillin-binding protein 2 [Gammaproteobacteria bacterium]|nr:penicillin-binding protein 2 [Gammaproteobacteria bacterium]
MGRKYAWRVYLVILLLIIALCGLLWRLVQLNLIDRHFLLQQSDSRTLRDIELPAHRGMITDREGAVLALSTPVYSAWVNPKFFQASSSQLNALSEQLNLPASFIQARTNPNLKKGFVYLKRQNTPNVMDAVKALQIPGVHFITEYQRFYPEGEVTAHVLGITNIDDQGQEGLELAYNDWLAGTPGKKEVLKDRMGHVIADMAMLKNPKQGRDLTLSIDHRIQYIAYRALKEDVEKFHAKAGSIVVLNAKTGEILAMANLPSYNPNSHIAEAAGDFRNRAVTDSFEPGSTMKPFTIALALESGKYTPTSLINTNPGYLRVGGYTIRDDEPDNGIIDLQKIIQVSSNIGAAKILLTLPPLKLWNLLRRMGFGQRTSSGFPGESAGRLIEHAVWYKSDVATLAYGYGIAVSTLQLAKAYSILADNGVRRPVSFLKLDSAPAGKQVIPEKVAKEVDAMLETVVTGKPSEGATGALARVPGYSVAGKTGTAYIAGANGYDKKKYNADFVGFAPASNPQLVIAVVVRDPQGEHFGAQVAAPVFSKVMGRALRILNIPPDNL